MPIRFPNKCADKRGLVCCLLWPQGARVQEANGLAAATCRLARRRQLLAAGGLRGGGASHFTSRCGSVNQMAAQGVSHGRRFFRHVGPAYALLLATPPRAIAAERYHDDQYPASHRLNCPQARQSVAERQWQDASGAAGRTAGAPGPDGPEPVPAARHQGC